MGYGSTAIINIFIPSARGGVLRLQNLTSTDVRFYKDDPRTETVHRSSTSNNNSEISKIFFYFILLVPAWNRCYYESWEWNECLI